MKILDPRAQLCIPCLQFHSCKITDAVGLLPMHHSHTAKPLTPGYLQKGEEKKATKYYITFCAAGKAPRFLPYILPSLNASSLRYRYVSKCIWFFVSRCLWCIWLAHAALSQPGIMMLGCHTHHYTAAAHSASARQCYISNHSFFWTHFR